MFATTATSGGGDDGKHAEGLRLAKARLPGVSKIRWPWFLWILVIALARVSAAEPAASHSWERINYPPISVPGIPAKLLVSVDSGSRDTVSHLRFSIHIGMGGHGEPEGAPIAANKITVRLHLPDGKIVPPATEGLHDDWIGFSHGGGVDWSLMVMFPWGENKLEESWIELSLPDQTYWIELPYGFTRDPKDPLLADPAHGVPAFPPAMKALPAKDVLVPWLSVEYDLGAIQNHWSLSLHVSNPFRARADVTLYHEQGRWDLHAPRTAMELKWPGVHNEAHCVGIRLTDIFRRTDDYLLGGGPDPEQGRIWGEIVVKVDDKSYACTVPSSLFKYTHGITDPYHKQRMPRPKPPDGDF